jgi:hypothetical protein
VARQAPVDTLNSNGAYLVVTALAWNLKAWWALQLTDGDGASDEQQPPEKQRGLRMEFKAFLNAFVRLPCQIVRTSPRWIDRLLEWNPWSGVFFRLVDRLHGERAHPEAAVPRLQSAAAPHRSGR